MLMQNFKPAHELSLNAAQYDALCKTLVLLETGKITHIKTDPELKSCWSLDKNNEFSGHFNMRYWGGLIGSHYYRRGYECGTISCIGGLAELVAGKPVFHNGSSTYNPDTLHYLFNPSCIPVTQWDEITTEQAAQALRNFLTTGRPNWKEIVNGR
jgi:hypothetical protein